MKHLAILDIYRKMKHLDILSPEWWEEETGGTGETQIIELDE